LPNVLHWRQRFKFLRGEFRYTAFGLLDRTHYRFYDWQCAQELLGSSGYEVLSAQADGNFPYSRFVPGMRRRIDRLALRTFPGFFGWQFVFRCRPVQSG